MKQLNISARWNSGTYNSNFIASNGADYIMDNHLYALWCWPRHIPQNAHMNIIHIDAHYDCIHRGGLLSTWMPHIIPFHQISKQSLSHYCGRTYSVGSDIFKLYRWDNYLSLFFHEMSGSIKDAVFATKTLGDAPNFHAYTECDLLSIPSIPSNELSTILNIDIDYFAKRYTWWIKNRDAIIARLNAIRTQWNVACTTIALSPSCSYGWKNSVEICNEISAGIGVDIHLNYSMKSLTSNPYTLQ